MQIKTTDGVVARLTFKLANPPANEYYGKPCDESELEDLLADRQTAATLLARIEQVRARRKTYEIGLPCNQLIVGLHMTLGDELDTVLAILDGKEQP